MSVTGAVVPAALAAFAFVVSERATWWLARATPALRVSDLPNERSLHTIPRPRTGGLALHGALLVALAAWLVLSRSGAVVPAADAALGWIAGAVLAAGALSFRDDVRSVPMLLRLAVQFLVATALVVGGGLVVRHVPYLPPLGRAAVPLSVLGLVWMANLYNFMDGMDGFAGGMAAIGFSFLAALAWLGGAPAPALLSLLVAAAAAGFLCHNFPPARIFMGDVGAVPLGFLAGALAVWGVQAQAFDIWAPFLVFSPFIVDATVTLAHRVLRGRKPWQAHRSHYYQRLVLSGWGHRRTVLAEYLLMGGTGLGALAYQALAGWERAALLVGLLLCLLGLGLLIERHAGAVGE